MKYRCENSGSNNYRYYGMRGIEVRFRSARELVDHIGLPPPGLQLDRIDTDGHYERGNVRWVDPATNLANRRPWRFRLGRRLTKDEFKLIHRLADRGLTNTRIAELIGITRQRVGQILRGVDVKSFVLD